VLTLLGFAATDYVITKTLSAADAAEHVIKNPLWPAALHGPRTQLWLTMFLLLMLGAMFLRGFREVIGLAVAIVGTYLLLNAIVVGSSIVYLLQHREHLDRWYANIMAGPQAWEVELHFDVSGGPWGILLVCLLYFPKLALGLSGFETGVAVMPLIRGDADDTPALPRGRIRNARKLLVSAALIMSVFLLGSAMATSTLIAPAELRKDGLAENRALAYLAHGERLADGTSARVINPMFGELFGTIYDISTVVILWFAGASAMAGLLNLVPQYLPRYGMAPEWARALRPLVVLFTAIALFVTWEFNANVHAQGAAYATGVLVLITSACVATVIDRWRRRSGHWLLRMPWLYTGISAVFIYTTLANIYERPVGLQIASLFILAIVVSSVVSRLMRATELRFQGWQFADDHSRFLWDSLKHLEFPALVPHRPGGRSVREKEEIIRREHHLGPEIPVVFLEAILGDASEFYQSPVIEVKQEEGAFIIHIERCASIAHTIAAVALELSKVGTPPEIHFGWSAESPMAANLNFLVFGEGNVPWMVRELILQAEPRPDRQPRIVIG
jgi:hypothetical protein